MIRTADGISVEVGAEVFDYYNMVPCTITSEPDDVGWFNVRESHPTYGWTRELLNGERICSIAHAHKMGWL